MMASGTMVSQITFLAIIPMMVGVATGVSCLCPNQYSPVCASSGETFSNRCMLDCHNFEQKGDLFPVGRGPCRKMQTPQFNKDLVQVKPSGCVCTKEYIPMCGSNFKTYSNRCTFNCAAKEDPSNSPVKPQPQKSYRVDIDASSSEPDVTIVQN